MTRGTVRRQVLTCSSVIAAIVLGACGMLWFRHPSGALLELHLPSLLTELEISIDPKSGRVPQRLTAGVYAIEFDATGRAELDSRALFDGWHQIMIMTPQGRFWDGPDFTARRRWHSSPQANSSGPEDPSLDRHEDGSRLTLEITYRDHVVVPERVEPAAERDVSPSPSR